MSIRILHIVSMLESGGVENLLYNYFSNIDSEKINASFATHSSSGQVQDKLVKMGCKIYFITPKRKNVFKNLTDTIKIIRSEKWDIVHSHINFGSIVPLAIARMYHVPIRISHAHGSKLRNSNGHLYIERLLSLILRLVATNYMACGNEAAIWLFGKRSFNNNSVIIVKNAIDLNRFIYSHKKRYKVRRLYKIDNDEFVIGQVARMTEEKNHAFTLRVFFEFLKLHPKSRLLLVGDGPLREVLEKKVVELKIQNNIVFIGNIDNVNEFLSAFDLLILPSFHEGLPLTPIEAQANGTQCLLSTNVPNEVAITELVHFMDLREGSVSWAEKIEQISHKADKKDTKFQVQSAGYDSYHSAKELEKVYLMLFNSIKKQRA